MKRPRSAQWLHLLTLILSLWLMTACTAIQPLKVEDSLAPVPEAFSHGDFDRVLVRFVNEGGMVDYSALQQDAKDLEAYYHSITLYSPDSHPQLFTDQNHRLAYWINAYNAGAIKTVLTYYPISSALDVKNPALLFFLPKEAGFFFFQRLTFGGATTNLYYLENQVIRSRFNEPRIHFALNCAAQGCPRLPRHAFTGDMLDRQLDAEARFFLSEERNFRIDHEEKTIYLSSIFDWFKEDFTGWYGRMYPDETPSLLKYISLYLPLNKMNELQTIEQDYSIRYIPYDWRLNDQT